VALIDSKRIVHGATATHGQGHPRHGLSYRKSASLGGFARIHAEANEAALARIAQLVDETGSRRLSASRTTPTRSRRRGSWARQEAEVERKAA
jgi:hypothetical protein